MKDLKYLAAYIIPILLFIGLLYKGVFSFLVIFFAFFLVPMLEALLPESTTNLSATMERENGSKRLFDWLLYLNVVLVYGIFAYFIYTLLHYHLTLAETFGLVISMGIFLASSGINVAHELGHRPKKIEQLLSKLLLLPSLYMHFTIEHNIGHHKNVGTPLDPATATKNQTLYAFWIQTVFGCWLGAWRIESKKLKKGGYPVWSLKNQMIHYLLIQAFFILSVLLVFGLNIMLLVIAAAVVSFLMLETINYVEHYGLYRNMTESGQYERAVAKHSWNSNHALGRIMLYELTRHSDHHYYANKKYQILKHHDDAPQLPLGYPGAMLLSLIPPLWFRVVNPLLKPTC